MAYQGKMPGLEKLLVTNPTGTEGEPGSIEVRKGSDPSDAAGSARGITLLHPAVIRATPHDAQKMEMVHK
jgi:hypothetical protein